MLRRSRALDPVRSEFGPMLGVVHAAGVAGDGYLLTKTIEEFQQVLAPKVRGIQNIVAWAGEERPEFIVSYSSMTAIIGGAGQSDYSAANAFLDGYTHQLRREGYNASSINWPRMGSQRIVILVNASSSVTNR